MDAPIDAGAASAGLDPSPIAQFPSPLILSILYFEDRAARVELRWLQKGLPDMLVAELSSRPDLIVVQRERLDEVMREQSLQVSGRIADETGVRIGQLLGATVLVTGSLAVVKEQLRLDAQLIEVERGAVLGTASAEGPIDHAPAVATELVQKVLRLLPGRDASLSKRPVVTPGLLEAAQANDAAEELTREGKLWQALREYERALRAAPGFGPARANYERVVKKMPGWQLLQLEGAAVAAPSDEDRLRRLVERLVASGVEADFGTPFPIVPRDDAITLNVPVTLRLSPSAAEAVMQAARTMGGRVRMPAEAEGPVELIPSSQPEFNRLFIEEVARPRRLYLRLLGRGGVTLGIYSRLRDWRLSTWVQPLYEETVRLETTRVITAQAVFTGLTRDQVAHLTAMKLTVDEVPDERATVSLDVREPLTPRAPPSPKPNDPTGMDEDATTPPSDDPGEDLAGTELEPLRARIEEAWNPAVSERRWARGYLPGNERRAIVGLTLRGRVANGTTPPRIIRSSGDPLFDSAAVAALKSGLTQWLAAMPVRDAAAPSKTPRAVRYPPQAIRVQFQLIKDIPALNLIGAQADATPLRTPTLSRAP